MALSLGPVAARGEELVVLYDGECGFCGVMLALLLSWDRAHRLDAAAIQSPRGAELLADVAQEERLESWHVIDARGVRRSAGAGIPVVLDALPGGKPLARLAARSPRATASAYAWVANHRTLLSRLLNARTRAWAVRVIAGRGGAGA
jgi:predicted DCC family thiol-disulfide oxidoreductase YuxK